MEIKQTNFAIIGLGGRGQSNLGELISIDGVWGQSTPWS